MCCVWPCWKNYESQNINTNSFKPKELLKIQHASVRICVQWQNRKTEHHPLCVNAVCVQVRTKPGENVVSHSNKFTNWWKWNNSFAFFEKSTHKKNDLKYTVFCATGQRIWEAILLTAHLAFWTRALINVEAAHEQASLFAKSVIIKMFCVAI